MTLLWESWIINTIITYCTTQCHLGEHHHSINVMADKHMKGKRMSLDVILYSNSHEWVKRSITHNSGFDSVCHVYPTFFCLLTVVSTAVKHSFYSFLLNDSVIFFIFGLTDSGRLSSTKQNSCCIASLSKCSCIFQVLHSYFSLVAMKGLGF